MPDTIAVSNDDDRPIWGAKAIGDEINLPPRKVFHLAKKGLLPCRNVGKRLVSTRRLLRGAVLPIIK